MGEGYKTTFRKFWNYLICIVFFIIFVILNLAEPSKVISMPVIEVVWCMVG